MANISLSRGDFRGAITHGLAAAALAPWPAESYGIAALAAAYAGDLEQASTLNGHLAAVAASPTLRALHTYVAGEIDNAAGAHATAAAHYSRASALARIAGSTFIDGIAALGLVTVQAAAGQVKEALHGYRELIDYSPRPSLPASKPRPRQPAEPRYSR